MFTFHWERIFGDGWVARDGVVLSDSIADARAVILKKNQLVDTHIGDWIEKSVNGVTRFVVMIEHNNYAGERIEFWQEPSIFGVG